MAGREVREYTNLSDPKDKKLGKGKDKIDDEDVTFQRMVAKGIFGFLNWAVDAASRCKKLPENEEVIFTDEAVKFTHSFDDQAESLDSDDLLYLKEQMEAEEDAERLLRRTEKRAFAAFKQAASLVDSSPTTVLLPLRVEPKPKSGIRQQDLLKKVVEIKPKRQRISTVSAIRDPKSESKLTETKSKSSKVDKADGRTEVENPVKSLLGLAYASSDDDED